MNSMDYKIKLSQNYLYKIISFVSVLSDSVHMKVMVQVDKYL